MKTKPILIIAGVVILLAAAFLFIRGKYLAKPEKGEITQFLNDFNRQIKAGNADSAALYFETDQKKNIRIFLKVLMGKTGTNGKSKPIFKVSLNTDDARISFTNPELAVATVAATFSQKDVPDDRSPIYFTIHKTGDKKYKFTQVDLRDFLKDYAAFYNKVITKTVAEKDIFSPITLAAFKTAEQLKTKYDSVVWFDHVDGHTYYYVIKGQINDDFYVNDDSPEKKKSDFKMGLVNPDLKEIIPVEYSMIHNVGGTIDGLIEVEKEDKKGFYDLGGKLVLPVNYDQIYPLKDGENLALLKNGEDYFYLKNDTTVSDKIVDFKIADALPQIKMYGSSFTLSDKSSKNLMELNAREDGNSIVVSPSYLVDWHLLPKFLILQNPKRKLADDGDGEGTVTLKINFDGDKKGDSDNWFQTAYYTIVDDFLGGRSNLYTTRNLLLVDKKHNKIMGYEADTYYGNGEGGGVLSGACNDNEVKAINDSLIEFKTTSNVDQMLLDTTQYVGEAPHYYYLQVKNGKLVPLKSKRIFPTQFVKMDDSYLQGCYTIVKYGDDNNTATNTINHATNDILQCMKNEIYASYLYKFKNERWNQVFGYRFSFVQDAKNTNVDDSLTTTDKYNINFINSKLNGGKTAALVSK